MKTTKHLIPLAAALILGSCGDGGLGPSDPDITASEVTLAFTGDSSGVGPSPHAGRTSPEGALAPVPETPRGSKGRCEVTVIWTTCPERTFSSYTLYRSETPGISAAQPSAEVLQVFTDPLAHEYIDNTVNWGDRYYYNLKTTNIYGEHVWSNEPSIELPEVGLPEGMEFVSIPRGSFQMGMSEGEPGFSLDEFPVHTVTFDYAFEMMTTEITQGMWQEVMMNGPSGGSEHEASLPLADVSWNESQEFVSAMNERDPNHEYRLPSEAEWEYCARAGTRTWFFWGDDSAERDIDQYAWWIGNSGGAAHPVGQKAPNAWGLFDMSGNLWEWCQDGYHDTYLGAPSDGSAWESPACTTHVDRGGSWISRSLGCLSGERSASAPDFGSAHLGFRLVRMEI